MHATVIDDWLEFQALDRHWNELLHRSRSNTIFLTWEWVRAWLDVTGERYQPLIVVVRDTDGRLRGIAPFYLMPYRLGFAGLKILRVLADWPTSAEYPDWIVDLDSEREVERTIVETLRRHGHRWHGLWMRNLCSWNGADEHIVRAFRASACYSSTRPVEFCSVPLPRSMSEYESTLSAGWRQQVRRKSRKILGKTDVTISRCDSARELPAYLDALFELHHRRWQIRDDEGVFRRFPELEEFYRRFAPTALRRGWLRLYALRQGEEFKALQLGYVYNNVFYQIQEGFDPDFAAGVGNVLRHKVIEECISKGLASYDFMAEASENKHRWKADTRAGRDLFIGRPGILTWLAFTAGIWPTGRYLRPAHSDDGGRSELAPTLAEQSRTEADQISGPAHNA